VVVWVVMSASRDGKRAIKKARWRGLGTSDRRQRDPKVTPCRPLGKYDDGLGGRAAHDDCSKSSSEEMPR